MFRRLVKILNLRKLYHIVLVHRSTLLFLTLATLVEQKKLLVEQRKTNKLLAEILRPIENEFINEMSNLIFVILLEKAHRMSAALADIDRIKKGNTDCLRKGWHTKVLTFW